MLFVMLVFGYAAYWYVYGRERDLFEGTEVESLPKEIGEYLKASNSSDDKESKRLSDLFNRQSAMLSAALEGTLKLNSQGTLDGTFVSQKPNWITNRVYVHVRVLERRHCGERLQNMFSDIDWDKNCAADPNHSVMDVVNGQLYQCFVGAVAYSETGRCTASTVLPFDSSKQSWEFSFNKVTGHPEDPLGLFR